MQFRSGQRDERRRRVLLDEMLTSPETTTTEEDSSTRDRSNSQVSPGKVYSDAASAQQQPPITCVIPKRPWTLLILGLLGAVAVVSVQALYGQIYLQAADAVRVSLEALNPAARGSLADWLAALLLGLGTFASLMTYAIRRHRLDDYRGRYQVWIWAAAALFVASLESVTRIHSAFDPLANLWMGNSLHPGAPWSVVVLTFFFGLLLLRMTWEIWRCRLATLCLVVATAGYVTSLAVGLHPVAHEDQPIIVMACSFTWLMAHGCLIYAAALYCRYVYLEAQSPSAPASRKKKPKMPKAASPTPVAKPAASTKNVRIDSAHQGTQSAVSPPKSQPTVPVLTTKPTQPAQTAGESPQTLSKAERRRLRKLERRHKRDEFDDEDP